MKNYLRNSVIQVWFSFLTSFSLLVLKILIVHIFIFCFNIIRSILISLIKIFQMKVCLMILKTSEFVK